jgi:hypothetical protein
MSDAGGALPHSWCLVFVLVWASGRHAISGHWAFFFKITLFSPIFPPFPLVLAFLHTSLAFLALELALLVTEKLPNGKDGSHFRKKMPKGYVIVSSRKVVALAQYDPSHYSLITI